MIIVYPDHTKMSHIPQAPNMYHWFTAAYVIIMAGLTGEPMEMKLRPQFLEPLGSWQKLNLAIFFTLYVMYVFFALILLLNLLIALLGSTFSKTQEDATLQGRIAFAHVVNRLELVGDFFGTDTHAGEADGTGTSDNTVFLFRDLTHDVEGELPSDHIDDNVFDAVPSVEPPAESMQEPRLTNAIAAAAAATEAMTAGAGEEQSSTAEEFKAELTAALQTEAEMNAVLKEELSVAWRADLKAELGTAMALIPDLKADVIAGKKAAAEAGAAATAVAERTATEVAAMSTRLASVESEMKAELVKGAAGMRQEVAALRAEISAEIRAQMKVEAESGQASGPSGAEIAPALAELKGEIVREIGEMLSKLQSRQGTARGTLDGNSFSLPILPEAHAYADSGICEHSASSSITTAVVPELLPRHSSSSVATRLASERLARSKAKIDSHRDSHRSHRPFAMAAHIEGVPSPCSPSAPSTSTTLQAPAAAPDVTA